MTRSNMSSLVRRVLVLAALLALTSGCYEGWDHPYGSGLPDMPQQPTPTPPPAAKPIGYVLFQAVEMSADAIASNTCFPQSGIRQFKTTEWTERISSITSALQNIADTVVVHTVQVGASDCGQLSTVTAEAVKQTPWDPDTSPESDTSGKPQFELVASFWEGEPAVAPPAPVTAADWSGWAQLIAEGRQASSLRYFVVSNPINGYFTQWQTVTSAGEVLAGTPINQVDPTAAGSSAREALIATDTTALIAWIEGKVP